MRSLAAPTALLLAALLPAIGVCRIDPYRVFSPPKASQNGQGVPAAYIARGPAGFAFRLTGFIPPCRVVIDFDVGVFSAGSLADASFVRSVVGITTVAAEVHDDAGRGVWFPAHPAAHAGCGNNIGPLPCTDVALYDFSAAGQLD